MRKYLLTAAATVALALAPLAFAHAADGDMEHGCVKGRDAMGHACTQGAMGHGATAHDAMGDGTMAHTAMGHDAMGHAQKSE